MEPPVARKYTLASIGDFARHERTFTEAAAAQHATYAAHGGSDAVVAKLDELCHEETMGEVRSPVVLVGEAGCGKSALLANWVASRRGQRPTPGALPELVFHHVAGCSRESSAVSTVLLRMVSELKAFFGLQMKVSSTESQLSREFTRALETSARKGCIVIVIDGVERLESRAFARLKWLPLHFPPNVRVVLSMAVSGEDAAAVTSSHAPSGASAAGDDHASLGSRPPLDSKTTFGDKGLAELARRGWSALPVRPLAPPARHAMVAALLAWHKGQAAALASDVPPATPATPAVGMEPSLTSSMGSYTPVSEVEAEAEAAAPLLSPHQVEAVVATPLAASPRFLRTLLDALALARRLGMDVALLLSSWLGARSVRELLEFVVKQWTRGWMPSVGNPLASPLAGAARGDPVGDPVPADAQRVVPGLGPALGGALSFLFASRLGLGADELKAVLLAEVSGHAGHPGEYKTMAPVLPLGSDAMMAHLQDICTSLGMPTVHGRLQMPPALGTLRGVVFHRHLKAGAALPRVQHALVAFFTTQPVTMRRAEELPWLLETVHAWPALKTVLLDLHMFDLLWADRLRGDLLRYWGILTGATALAAARRPGDLEDLSLLPPGVSPASRGVAAWMRTNDPLRAAPGKARKKRRKPKKRSGGSTAPPSAASSVASSPAGGVTLWGLDTTAAAAAASASATTPSRPKRAPGAKTPVLRRQASTKSTQRLPKGGRGKAGGGVAPPPKAATQAADALVKSDIVEEYNKAVEVWFSSTSPSFTELQRVLKNVEELMFEFGDMEGPTPDFVHCSLDEAGLGELGVRLRTLPAKGGQPPSQISLNKSDRGYYYYRRWVWIQFPWMVLKNMDAAAAAGGGGGEEPSTSAGSPAPFWKRKAMGVPSSGTGAGVDADTLAASKVQEAVDSHASRGMGTVPRRARSKVPSKSPASPGLLPDGPGFGASAPPSLRPKYRPGDSIFHGGVSDPKALDTRDAPLPFNVNKGQLRARPAHASDYPIDNKEAKVMVEHAKLEQLRKLHDRMAFQIAKREKELGDLEAKVEERDTVDRKNQAELDAAEAKIAALQRRLEAVNATTARTEREGSFLQRVLALAEANPPNEPGHMARIDRVLNAVKMEFAEASTVEKVVDFELRHLTTHDLPKLRSEIERSNQYRAEIMDRLQAQQRAPAGPPGADGMDMPSPLRPTASRREGRRMDRLGSMRSIVKDGEAVTMEDPALLMRYVDAFRRIKAATGVRDVDQLREVFANREVVLASLAGQREEYESRLAELQGEHAGLQAELSDMEHNVQEFGSRDIRQHEEDNAKAEAALHVAREKHDYVVGVLKTIKAGALHLAQLLGYDYTAVARHVAGVRANAGDDRAYTVADDDVEVVLELCASRASAMLAAMASGMEDGSVRPDTGRLSPGRDSLGSRPGTADSRRSGGSATLRTGGVSPTSSEAAPALSVLGLRTTPRGQHLRTTDLAKTSSPAVVHVVSDRKRLATEVATGGDDSDSESELGGVDRPPSGTAPASLHPRLQGFSAMELHAYIGRGLGVTTRVKSTEDPAASARRMPTAKTMQAVRDPANHVVDRKQWKQFSTALKRRAKRMQSDAGDDG